MFIALPLDPVICKSAERVTSDLRRIIKEYAIDHIIIGLPLSMHSSDSAQTRRARLFGEKLQIETGVAVELIDERLTSKIAIAQMHATGMDTRGMKQHKDSLSALIMLQEWLRIRNPVVSRTEIE